MGKFDNILIVSDIDETFLGTGGVIVEKNIEAIKYFLSEGGKFTFATGRVHDSLLSTIPIAKEIVSAPGIMSNGGYLYDFHKEEFLNCMAMPDDLAREIVECIYVYNDEFGLRYSNPNNTFYCRFIPDYLGGVEPSYSKSRLITPDQWHFKNCCKVVARGRSEELDDLRALLEAKFNGLVEIVKSGDTFLEVLALGSTKGNAVKALRRYYNEQGIDVKIYACGDYENDMAMLKTADVAVCPSNAMDEIKAIADYVLCHCSDGLIANLIEKIDA